MAVKTIFCVVNQASRIETEIAHYLIALLIHYIFVLCYCLLEVFVKSSALTP